ncbi:outer membrane porin HofQ [Anatilimnocola aggregata]|uniref:Outer membrane porin HofQ n=1 Tax=Anatilimnocola aggregata TaxID=2528021 RepID=A0A517YL39_9BACT|nr:pilus assembly protein N-terminal domain-containing protein [Anatilimnocola aggregata]QDU26056.1 outer membrane porin HofQ [Anatilimnocola aggregata]QDU30945.1 outer membrane porin HofQ [Anatilimnocola aggregata]
MLGSSRKRRARSARRWQRWLAASLCTASFLTGHVLFGQQPGTLAQRSTKPLQRVAIEAAPSELPPGESQPGLPPILAGSNVPRPVRPAQTPALLPPVPRQTPATNTLAPIVAAPATTAAPLAFPAGAPSSASPWMQDIRQLVETTPGVKRPTPTPSNAAATSPTTNNPAPILSASELPRPGSQIKPASGIDGAEQARTAQFDRAPVEPIQSAASPFAPAPLPQSQLAIPQLSIPQPPPLEPVSRQPLALQPEAPINAAPIQNTTANLAPSQRFPLAPTNDAARPFNQPTFNQPADSQTIELPVPRAPQPVNFAQPAPVPPAPRPLNLAPMADPVAPQEDAMRRANSPFEVIDETGAVQVMVRRSKLLRTKVDIYRTAVVDDSICDIVQFTPREVSLIGKSQGSTHITFWFDDPAMQPVTYLIKVVPDVAQVKQTEDTYKMLQDVINEMFPDSKIQLLLVADKLIIRGQAKDSEEAAQIVALVRSQSSGGGNGAGFGGGFGGGLSEGAAAQVLSDSATGSSQRSRLQVINMLRVPGVQQVALRVKIAEMNRSAARGIGVGVRGNINFTDNPDGSQLFLQSMLNVVGGAGPALLTQLDGDDIQIGVRYLQSRGVLRLLSEPTLVTMSGTPATFIAGGEFAVPTLVGSAGLNAVTTDFRAFGAIISFMPTVVDKDRIRLQVSPEFSQINSQLTVNNTPGLKVRAATTTVEMREGQTLAIAGLLEDNMTGNTVGDLPFLAKIFGNRDIARNETELLILVTPELVQAMEPEEVPPLPGFDITEPTSAQFFLHGDLEGNPTQDYRSTVWPRLKKRYGAGGPAMTSGPFGHGQ